MSIISETRRKIHDLKYSNKTITFEELIKELPAIPEKSIRQSLYRLIKMGEIEQKETLNGYEFSLKEMEEISENSPIFIRVEEYLHENKNNSFSNKDLSKNLNLLERTVSAITSKLLSLGTIRVAKFKKGKIGYSQIFQSCQAPKKSIEIERTYKSVEESVKEIFYKNIDSSYSCRELASFLKKKQKIE